jgi:ABC-type multidrug transport system ATPase subunit
VEAAVVIEVRGLSKSFGRRTVLDRLDLAAGPGEAVALLGANGSGKTTTLRCIVGLSLPDAGRILVDGRDAVRQGREARARLSYLPQRVAFPATLTVREVLVTTARLRGLALSRADQEIAACGLDALAGRFVGELSGGQRQRLGLAVAFLPDVPVYLFDEPSAHLDAAALDLVVRRARQLREDGRTIVFTTHVPADVDALATHVERLVDGRRVPAGAPGTVFAARSWTPLADEERCAS